MGDKYGERAGECVPNDRSVDVDGKSVACDDNRRDWTGDVEGNDRSGDGE